MSIIELPVCNRAINGKKRLQRVVHLIAAAAVSASLIAAAVGPASAAVRPSAPVISVSGNGRPAVALRAALNRVRWTGDGQFALASAELSSRARSADSAFVAGLNRSGARRGLSISPATTSSMPLLP